MFDGSLPEIADLTGLDDAALVDAARGWARAENAACARKQAVMAELFARRTGLDAGERELWWVDPEAAVTAELAAAQHISRGLALHQTHRGVALRDRLPKVAALFEAGEISDLLVRTIVWRTYLITDETAMAAVDGALAEQVKAWGALSIAKTEAAIDALVDAHDPGALRRSRHTRCGRDVSFGAPDDEAGFLSLWARLHATDGAALKHRVQQLTHGVCEADPRTQAERRADALGALARGHQLSCGCGSHDCTAAAAPAPTNAVVHVVADAATITAATDSAPAPAAPQTAAVSPVPQTHDTTVTAASTSAAPTASTEPGAPPAMSKCPAPPAYVMGGGILPAPLLAATLEHATIRPVRHPGIDAPAEPRYRPTAALAQFVRCRDLTCRWPGCDTPADRCDIDHTVPHPAGPTHASNLKCYCRFHHLCKTFLGWQDKQLPDGTLIVTSPTGHTYTTHPGSKLLFPKLCHPTGDLALPDTTIDNTTDRGVMMPKRRHTRAHNRQHAITAERRLNDAHVAERNKPPPF
jgi:hypothetical protein